MIYKEAGTSLKNKSSVLIVISNKGGVGKTSIAIAMSMFYAQKSKHKTLLLELDSSPGDFKTIFDIEEDKSLELALRFPQKYRRYVKNIYKNLDVLNGISNPLGAEGIKPKAINILFDYIYRDYKFIIIDTQTTINGIILDALRFSDVIFIVTDYSLESISRISSLFKFLVDKFSISKSKMKVIINKKKFLDFYKIWDITKIIELPIELFISMDTGFSKTNFLFNREKIFRTKFFRQVSKAISNSLI